VPRGVYVIVTSALLAENEDLKRRLALRDAEVAALREAVAESKKQQDALQHRLDLLLRSVYGQKSEKVVVGQGLLSFAGSQPAPPPAPPAFAPAKEAKKPEGHGRGRLPSHLHRDVIIHDVAPEDRRCCDCNREMKHIGDDECEILEWTPGHLVVKKHVRRKYACSPCGTIVTGPAPDQVIERGLAGPGLIAHVAVSKYGDHLPLNRLEGILAREGVEVSRQTMCDWIAAAAELLRPVWELMRSLILDSGFLLSDETPVRIQDVGKTRQGYIRVFACERPRRLRVYQYAPTRGGLYVKEFLGDWEGGFLADAFSGYDQLYAGGKVVEFGCNAHARRHFFDAKETHFALAHEALARYRLLYAVEREADDADRADGDAVGEAAKLRRRHHLRIEKAKPVLDEFEEWLDTTRPSVLPKSPIGQAVAYALNHWQALRRYADFGEVPIDNNLSERELRPVAVGRKNWLFAGSDEFGAHGAVLFSTTSTCKANGVDPWAWMADVLPRLSTTPQSRLVTLLPDEWARERGVTPKK
jgi:transposase